MRTKRINSIFLSLIFVADVVTEFHKLAVLVIIFIAYMHQIEFTT